jgi:hypothetical protein
MEDNAMNKEDDRTLDEGGLEFETALSRRHAIREARLVDVTELASKFQFCWPFALTRAVYGRYVGPSTSAPTQLMKLRLCRLLQEVREGIPRGFNESEIPVAVTSPEGHTDHLRVVSSLSDETRHLITVMLPRE